MTFAPVVERRSAPPATAAGPDVVVAVLDLAPAALRAAAAVLSADERERASLYVADRARDRFVAGRAALRSALGRRLGLAPAAVRFAYNEHGKPSLHPQHGRPALDFNVAHAGDALALAFHDGAVGIDIEREHDVRYADDIVRRFFTAAERADYLALAADRRRRAFLAWWTRKEAFVKAIGAGLDHPLASFDVTLAPDEPARLRRVGGVPGERCGWALRSFGERFGLVGAVAFRVPGLETVR